MRKTFYLPFSDSGRDLWLQNFYAKLGTYAAKYGIPNSDVNDVGTAMVDYSYRLSSLKKITAYAQQWTAYKNALRNGLPAGATAQAPVAPDLGPEPATAAPDIFTFITNIVNKIKNNKAYSDADGQDLGIVGAGHHTDVHTMQPALTPKAGTGGKPSFSWSKNGMDAIAIYKDSGNGFVKYDTDNFSPYDDKAPLPASAATWKYKAIYLIHDEEVGQWSSVISMNVGG